MTWQVAHSQCPPQVARMDGRSWRLAVSCKEKVSGEGSAMESEDSP